MIKFFFFINLIIVSFLISSCDTSDKPAHGPEDEIYVIADSLEYQSMLPALDSAFEKIIYTPQPEKLFTLKRISANELEQYKHQKNIIIAAPLNSESLTSQFVNAFTDTSLKEKIRQSSVFPIKKYDLWAKDQLVMFLTCSTMDELKSKIKNDADDLLYAFQKISDKRLYESLYSPQYEQKNIEGKFLRDYGWIIYVQKDYNVAVNDPSNNFVWIKRTHGSDMGRWIFIHWIDNATPIYLNEDSIRAVRNRVTQKFYKESGDTSYVQIAQDYYTTNEVNFKNKYAIFTQGLWELSSKEMGGPFVNYTFYDENTKRVYMLDGSIFAPKYYKRNLIQQMDVTLQSFMTESELNKNRKEELLTAAED